jgi:polysaccharide biosynthesis/export protein
VFSQRLVTGLALAIGLLSSACASTGPFTWYHALPASEWQDPSASYVIAAGDTIFIRVYDQDPLSTRGKIRTDGKIAMPFVGELLAAGKRPDELGREVEARLKQFFVEPRVIVNVEDSPPVLVSVLGEVSVRGNLAIAKPATLMSALAQSGGLNEFADRESIFVIRQTPTFQRIRFTYEALVKDKGAGRFPLRTGDTILVE